MTKLKLQITIEDTDGNVTDVSTSYWTHEEFEEWIVNNPNDIRIARIDKCKYNVLIFK